MGPLQRREEREEKLTALNVSEGTRAVVGNGISSLQGWWVAMDIKESVCSVSSHQMHTGLVDCTPSDKTDITTRRFSVTRLCLDYPRFRANIRLLLTDNGFEWTYCT
ncbi:hypothetical protein BaRGS_00014676 [Batillaria attramentaria]|uniref:Uncharacterized protein n=1 Tax=Batillaria attramentaria TaxID=370345 RepID=A0ABD0L3B4_9CAEN